MRDITAMRIDNYLYARKHGKLNYHEHRHQPVSNGTIRHDYIAIKAFLNWCVRRDFLISNPAKKVDPPKLPVKFPKFLDPDTAKKLVAYAASDQFEKDIPSEKVSIRYMILIELFSGVRFEKELFQIRKKDVLIDQNTIRIHTSKSGKYKLIPYNPVLNEYLQPLLDRLEDDDRLFPVKQFPRRQWKRLQEIMHIDITPYQLKHTFATMFYMQKKDLVTLQSILGHSDITTTRRYAQTVDEYRKKQAETFTY